MRRSNRSGADLVVQVDNVSKSEVRVSGNKSTLRPLEDKGHDSQVVVTGDTCIDNGVVIADMHNKTGFNGEFVLDSNNGGSVGQVDDVPHNQSVEGLPTEHEKGEHEVIGSDKVQDDVELQSLPNVFVLSHMQMV